jgi:hypothetical protein
LYLARLTQQEKIKDSGYARLIWLADLLHLQEALLIVNPYIQSFSSYF